MPTILIENGFRLFFFADEGFESPHVHVEHQAARAKFWIGPVSLARNQGMRAVDLKKADRLVRKHEKLIEEKWNEFLGRKKK